MDTLKERLKFLLSHIQNISADKRNKIQNDLLTETNKKVIDPESIHKVIIEKKLIENFKLTNDEKKIT